ncbi:Wzz/FepE/Etk N-terminal domain-containing protein [Bacillus paranthracis]|uniref:YveK family protein n=1 Tax=Bacillus paranthracis TaxID=2026186 RepID=UPI000200F9D0|nr:Wzz/FepE/Etk N-terminal domain-containing protein [Bacillus paranthracis]ADY24484.1 capsular polysaccharide biosynthesis [Bacillus thuringiensis serovar finitimus YBT-020]MRC72585.1 capsular biosynthesis protein [Bacillus thuringiensis]OTX72979.1 capsular biosynthesis protein [Bacillus thuringiensis serovar finitimus]MCR6800776.1 Wzz/FepE/Etk N-terminal domain-containing protein [Bacillus paranthracis]MEC3357081.1 Wzz/FepE/Etk N-terminal domain-containing protein [Bacillus paranthracis]
MEETISLKELFHILKKRLAMILVITFGAAIVSAIISFFFMTPIYQSSTQILVNQKKQEGSMFQAGEVQTNIQLTNTYKVIIKSPVILEQVNEKLNLNMTAQALTKKINVANEKDSQVISVTADDKDPKVARDIANATADVFKGEVAKIMNVDNVTVLSKAEVAENQSPIKPRPMLNVAIAFLVGLMAAVGLAFLLEYLDNTVKKEEDVENLLGLPVLGIVARMDEETMNVKSHAPSSRKVRGQTIGS